MIAKCYRHRQEELKQIEQDKQREREEKRKEKNLKKLREKDQHEIDGKIRLEEKRLLVVQRRLESIRLLDSLFERIKVIFVYLLYYYFLLFYNR